MCAARDVQRSKQVAGIWLGGETPVSTFFNRFFTGLGPPVPVSDARLCPLPPPPLHTMQCVAVIGAILQFASRIIS